MEKAANPARGLQGRVVSPVIELYFEICQLKQLYRKGWLLRGVPPERCESVAEHSFGVAMLALCSLEGRPELDAPKVLKLALIHDIGEIDAGDITPADGITPEQKRDRELECVRRVTRRLPGREEWRRLFIEYLEVGSPEAAFIHELEKVEMALQATVYDRQGFTGMSEFRDSARQVITDRRLSELADELGKLAADANH